MQTNEIFLLVGEVLAQIAAAFCKGRPPRTRAEGTADSSSSSLDADKLEAARAPFADFVQEPWWDVAAPRDTCSQDAAHGSSHAVDAAAASLPGTLRALCEESSALLRRAFALSIGPLPEPLQLALSAERFGRVVGMFEQNNVGVRAPSPIPGVVRELLAEGEGAVDGFGHHRGTAGREVLREAAGLVMEITQEDEDCADEDDEDEGDTILGILRGAVDGADGDDDGTGPEEEGLFAPLDGTALYSLVCCMNHSCRPNCVVRYPAGGGQLRGAGEPENLRAADPLVADVVLLEDVPAGVELTQSYVTREMGLAERRKALEDYGFLCACPRCREEEAATL